MHELVTTRSADYSILELAVPGRETEPAGVLLYDADADALGLRLRRDWDEIVPEEEVELFELLEEDLTSKSRDMGPKIFLQYLEDTLSNMLRISDRRPVLLAGFDATLNRLYNRIVPATVRRFVTHLPVCSCRAAAGRFSEPMRVENDSGEWVEAPPGLRLTKNMFVATVTGRSMEPVIRDGSRCIFRFGVAGSRSGRLVLVENLEESDEGGERYTIKRYESEKTETEDGWRHTEIRMVPLNPEFETWTVEPESAEQEKIRVLAEFLEVLD